MIEYLRAENTHGAEVMEPLSKLQNNLYGEILSHTKEAENEEIPFRHDSFMYYCRTCAGQPYKRHCRRPIDSQAEQIILDEMEVAKGFQYSVVGSVEPSPNHMLVAYSVDNDGSEIYILRVRDIATGDDLTDVIEKTSGNFIWGAGSIFFLKILADESLLISYLFPTKPPLNLVLCCS